MDQACPTCQAPATQIAEGTVVIYECAEHGMIRDGALTRKRKICTKCGHPECPFCESWCDVMVDDGEGDRDFCCDAQCTYEVTS